MQVMNETADTNEAPETNKLGEAVDDTANPPPDAPKRHQYDVGYCNPPKDSWFQPGVSGNPKGRPKGSKNKAPPLDDKNITAILREEVFQLNQVQEGEAAESISVMRAVTQRLVKSALDGNFRAAQWVISAGRTVEAADAAEREADYQYAEAYKARFEDPFRTLYGNSNDPVPVPNPHDIILDKRRRRAFFAGPRNAEEGDNWDEIVDEIIERESDERD